MSIDINWETLTSGPDGDALAVTIRDFIQERFEKITLPKFIRSVQVHSFDFGTVVPELEVKDVCDPLQDFYEGEDETDSGSESGSEKRVGLTNANTNANANATRSGLQDVATSALVGATAPSGPPYSDETRRPQRRLDPDFHSASSPYSLVESQGYFQSRSATPAIPGGTSNLNRLHHPFSTGIQGAPTPLSAFAGGHFASTWADAQALPSSRDVTSTGVEDPYRRGMNMPLESTSGPRDISPNDIQTVVRVKYSGDVRLSLTAEILLDYPMDSFVGIPLKLNVTGLDFDGVAILAYIKKKLHFCFLCPEDADALVGGDLSPQTPGTTDDELQQQTPIGGLFENIKVDSEIGQRNNNKQVLKNVGKVEKFVLEQVKRIFESELVYPSFWTFLV